MRYRGTTYEYCTHCRKSQECSVDVAKQSVTCKACGSVLYRDRAAVTERLNVPNEAPKKGA